jgi:hypothetical protein
MVGILVVVPSIFLTFPPFLVPILFTVVPLIAVRAIPFSR